jgi:alkylhydroperoxidase/carboxymuconolactone decarboxylase family protein YurZ
MEIKPEEFFEVFRKEYPKAGKSVESLLEELAKDSVLDPKTRALINIGINTARMFQPGLRYYIPKAIEAGATREEIMDTVIISLVPAGLASIVTALPVVLEELDKGGLK